MPQTQGRPWSAPSWKLVPETEMFHAQRAFAQSTLTPPCRAQQATDEARRGGFTPLLSQHELDRELRTVRITILREAIRNGTYSVPAAKVADKLIDTIRLDRGTWKPPYLPPGEAL